MMAPAPAGAAERALSHSSRAIRYIFLDGCKNISTSHALASAGAHKIYKVSASGRPESKGSGHFYPPKKRLPVFRQLCGEDVPGTASGGARLQTSSQGQKEPPRAKAPRETKKGWRKRPVAGRSPCDKA
ncbi:hypothetical protein Anapl_01681, partial [Anas platyrhynchos]